MQPSRFSEGSELLSHVLIVEAGLTDDFYLQKFTRHTSSSPFKSFEAGCKVVCRPEPDLATYAYEVECMHVLSKRSTSYPSAVHFVFLMVSSDRRQSCCHRGARLLSANCMSRDALRDFTLSRVLQSEAT